MDHVYSESYWNNNYLKDFVPNKQGTEKYQAAEERIVSVFKNNIDGVYKEIEL